jgi:ribosomal protein S1
MDATTSWEDVKRNLLVGAHVHCRVKEHRAFGVFVTIGLLPFDGLIPIIQFKDSGRMTPADYPPIGSEVEAVVIGFQDSNREIYLGVKPSQLSAKLVTILAGIRLLRGDYLPFGFNEVNKHLAKGSRIISIDEAKPIMFESQQSRLEGFAVNVHIEMRRECQRPSDFVRWPRGI